MTATRSQRTDSSPAQTAPGGGVGDESPRTLNTPRKRALLEVLEGADGFLRAAELHGRLCADLAPQGLRVGITTVYNQLRTLAQSGAVDTLHGDDGETLGRALRQAQLAKPTGACDAGWTITSFSAILVGFAARLGSARFAVASWHGGRGPAR